MALRRLFPATSSIATKSISFGVGKRSFALAVRFHENGDAEKVYKLETLDQNFVNARLAANEVGLKFLAAPINPSDVNIANGTYGIQPKLPAIAGNEGVAVVQSVGSEVKGLKVGDWVLPTAGAFGTWTQYNKAPESELIQIANDIPAAYAATLSINPATAYRLLRDFVQLKPGDVIIQNGANSMVGLTVLQMAKEMGVKTINVVRDDRPDLLKTIRLLTNLGGDVNIPASFLNSPDFKEMVSELSPIKLGLNCVGGEATTDLARHLAPGATLVTYGGMSRKHLTIPFDLLAYKQLQLKGFWIADWYNTHSVEERKAMYNEIIQLYKTEKLVNYFQMVDLDDFEYAMKQSQKPFAFRKIVLNIDYPDRFKEHDELDDDEYWHFDTTVR